MEVDDDIFHFSIIDGPLSGRAPRLFSADIIGKDANDIDLVKIGEFQRHGILDPSAHHKMQFAHALSFQSWGESSG